jgi:hypothetical protein
MKDRLRYAWHVLQGKPLMYRMRIENGAAVLKNHTWVIESHVINTAYSSNN